MVLDKSLYVYFNHDNSYFGKWIADKYDSQIDTVTFPLSRIRYPVIFTILYVILVTIFSPKESKETNKPTISSPNTNAQANNEMTKPAKKKFDNLTRFIFVHNVLLCLFSFACFMKTFPTVADLLFRKNLSDSFCKEWVKVYDGTYGYWGWLFYLSKYYEFVDTWIIIAKGRKPEFLQTFHHVGAVFSCWSGVAYRSTSYYLFTTLNSFIHTIMYCYYACSTVGLQFKYKSLITTMQMIQFWVGNTIWVTQGYNFRHCMSEGDTLTGFLTIVYTSFLLILFRTFYSRAYTKDQKKKE